MKAAQWLRLQGFWAASPTFPSPPTSSLHLPSPGKPRSCEGGKQDGETGIQGRDTGESGRKRAVESRLCFRRLSGSASPLPAPTSHCSQDRGEREGEGALKSFEKLNVHKCKAERRNVGDSACPGKMPSGARGPMPQWGQNSPGERGSTGEKI